ncbi:citramalyl-CoA lyase, mitochondrial isoform X2 [Agrilus planipennis]|uniref:Citramalyl-CoA lyase, mitochondrial isoform X2 n=1 Tax=Agrilus planipennis TaxID=224129 RepID=A0A1W4X2F1_AGRPL|nr:citramalyl-CoA lyase, mitochondrial isoform X2 [Agrilus planipennis]
MQKEQARNTIFEFLNNGKPKKSREFDWGVRINSVKSELCQNDLDVILTAQNLPDTISLPKVNDTEELKWFSSQLERFTALKTKISVILFIETAQGIMNLKEICTTAKKLSENRNFEPVALVFGGDDYLADIGARKTDQLTEVLYARQKLVMMAKAFQLQAIDVVYIQYKDLDGLKQQSIEGANMGYTGKQVIHPDQVPVVQEAFLPSEKQIKWAKDLIEAYHKYAASGKGAFNFNGIMVDSPTLKQAENLIKFVEVVGKDTNQ